MKSPKKAINSPRKTENNLKKYLNDSLCDCINRIKNHSSYIIRD